MRTSYKRDLLSTRPLQIRDEVSPPSQVARILLSWNWGAHPQVVEPMRLVMARSVVVYLLRVLSISYRTGSRSNCGNNVRIARAAANVAGQPCSNLSIRPCTVSYNEVSPGYQHSGRTITALQTM